jgi:hypothetical protein
MLSSGLINPPSPLFIFENLVPQMYIQIKSYNEDGAFLYFLRILNILMICTVQRTFCYPHREIHNQHLGNPKSHGLFIFFLLCLFRCLDIRFSAMTGKQSNPTDSYYLQYFPNGNSCRSETCVKTYQGTRGRIQRKL